MVKSSRPLHLVHYIRNSNSYSITPARMEISLAHSIQRHQHNGNRACAYHLLDVTFYPPPNDESLRRRR